MALLDVTQYRNQRFYINPSAMHIRVQISLKGDAWEDERNAFCAAAEPQLASDSDDHVGGRGVADAQYYTYVALEFDNVSLIIDGRFYSLKWYQHITLLYAPETTDTHRWQDVCNKCISDWLLLRDEQTHTAFDLLPLRQVMTRCPASGFYLKIPIIELDVEQLDVDDEEQIYFCTPYNEENYHSQSQALHHYYKRDRRRFMDAEMRSRGIEKNPGGDAVICQLRDGCKVDPNCELSDLLYYLKNTLEWKFGVWHMKPKNEIALLPETAWHMTPQLEPTGKLLAEGPF